MKALKEEQKKARTARFSSSADAMRGGGGWIGTTVVPPQRPVPPQHSTPPPPAPHRTSWRQRGRAQLTSARARDAARRRCRAHENDRVRPQQLHVRAPEKALQVQEGPPLIFPLSELPELPLRHLAPASPSPSGGTSLPTSVVEMKSSTAWLHLATASRSRIFLRRFHLPVSSLTSAHRIFCCHLHLEHSLKRWPFVCVGLWHHQHCAEGRTLAQCKCCPMHA